MADLDLNSIAEVLRILSRELLAVSGAEQKHLLVTSNGLTHTVEYDGTQIWTTEEDPWFAWYQEEEFAQMLRDRLNSLFSTIGEGPL